MTLLNEGSEGDRVAELLDCVSRKITVTFKEKEMLRTRTVLHGLLSSVVAPVALVAVLVSSAIAQERPFLHPLFTDSMVLQRDAAVPIWGWTRPGTEVKVGMAGKSAAAVAGADGKWLVRLGPFRAGGPHKIEVSGPKAVTVKDVLVGDVWICSGQSNMEMGMGGVNHAAEEISRASFPGIRLFTVAKRVAMEPESVPGGQWSACSPETVGGFSAVGYFFGRHLHEQLKVPVGLIHTSWGGTVAEAWTSAEALETMPDFRPTVEQFEQMVAEINKGKDNFDAVFTEWWKKNDPGTRDGWADPAFSAAGWKQMNLPQLWEEAGLPNYDGIVWFRKEVDVPTAWAGRDAALHLGPIDDIDTTWLNGEKVGGLEQYTEPRDYRVPEKLLKTGKNLIAVRVLDTGGGGGIYGRPEDMRLEVQGEKPISLAGPWVYRESVPMAKLPPVPHRVENNPNTVTVLYNGMIAPLVPFGIKGAIWYQGESNAGRARQYRVLLETMIKDWRSRFGAGDFPFFIVQLANFMGTDPEPVDSAWAELREAQFLVSRDAPKAGLAVAIDIGDAADIHPRNKQDVGRRLALAALAVAHGQGIEYSGPVYSSMEKEGGKIRLKFGHLGGGLVVKGEKLQGFAIAGEDRRFVWADATIDGDTVVVSSPKVEKPAAVRYAWANNPVCNLYNKAGLPAVPFRTDAP